MYIHKHHAPNEPPAFPALPRQADGRQQRAAAPRAAAGALGDRSGAAADGGLGQGARGARGVSCGLMGVNQQNGDFNGMYPLVN